MGNGAKAQQKRERNAAKSAGEKGSKSQLKTNEASMSIVCNICKQAFMVTTREPAFTEHAQNKHGKTKIECFP